MLTKVIECGSWTGPGMDHPAAMMKISRRGLVGSDRFYFLEKRAGAHVFADKIASLELKPGDIPIHLIAIGAQEAYGPNRNGDAFKEAVCREVHDTFVKYARLYRNHKNKDPAKSFGKVALSAYNEPMRRIELLVIGNGTKEAADRNGGLVMTKESVDKLENGEFLPFSMACRLPYDVCDNCMNKAANRSQYCTSETCINPTTGARMFGCRDGLTKVSSNGQQQFVHNPNARMFDISEVIRPADRIAHGGLADYLQKAANASHGIGGAELAEWWADHGADLASGNPADAIFGVHRRNQVKLASALALIEEQVENNFPNQLPRSFSFSRGFVPHTTVLDTDSLGSPGTEKFAVALGSLASRQIMLPLATFIKLATGESGEKAAELSATVSRHLPGIFSRMSKEPGFDQAIDSNRFATKQAACHSEVSGWVSKHAAALSLETPLVRDRVFRSAVQNAPNPVLQEKGAMIKTAAAGETTEKLARQYASYQLAFLSAAHQDPGQFRDLCDLVVAQNYLSS
jgi:hypothetical protein